MKLIIFYLPANPGLPIGGNIPADVGDESLEASLFLSDESSGVNLLLLNVKPPCPAVFIGIKFMKELVAVFDIDGFLRFGSAELLLD